MGKERFSRRDFLNTAFLASAVFVSKGLKLPELNENAGQLPSLKEFTRLVENGENDQIVGIYSSSVFAKRVVYQPEGRPDYVSSHPDKVTVFSLATYDKSIGLLAHDYLAGKYFFDLKKGSRMTVVYGNRKLEQFKVSEIKRYQAINPRSITSEFVDLQTNKRLSYLEVFYQVYGRRNTLTLQTCIQKDGNPYWGRYFVLARKQEASSRHSHEGRPFYY